MNKTTSLFNWPRFEQLPIIGILRGYSFATVLKIADAYAASNFTTLEITMNTDGATSIIANLRQRHPHLNVGAGTVRTPAELDQALTAGAQFIVTPILDEHVVSTCVQEEVPVFPGAFSPTEVFQAWESGATAVKVFPATQLGPSYVKELLAPLEMVKLVPTGGVSLSNIAAYFQAGAVGVGMGGSLFDKQLIEEGDFEQLSNHFRQVKSAAENY